MGTERRYAMYSPYFSFKLMSECYVPSLCEWTPIPFDGPAQQRLVPLLSFYTSDWDKEPELPWCPEQQMLGRQTLATETFQHSSIDTYIYILYTHTYTDIQIQTHRCTYIHIHTHTYTYRHIHTDTQHIHVDTHTFIQIHTDTYRYIHIDT